MTIYLAALLLGLVTGMRTMAAPTAVSLAAASGRLDVGPTMFAFLGNMWAAGLLIVLAVGELIADKLPMTPSRKVPVQFGARIAAGAFAGATVGAAHGVIAGGALAGVLGAIAGTLGGSAFRTALASAFGRDLPAALTEDALAYIGAALVVMTLL